MIRSLLGANAGDIQITKFEKYYFGQMLDIVGAVLYSLSQHGVGIEMSNMTGLVKMSEQSLTHWLDLQMITVGLFAAKKRIKQRSDRQFDSDIFT